MEGSETTKLPKRAYTTELKERAVAQVASGRGIATIAQELGLSDGTPRNGVKTAKAVTAEPMGLSRPKRETEIIKKAAVYFAKEVP